MLGSWHQGESLLTSLDWSWLANAEGDYGHAENTHTCTSARARTHTHVICRRIFVCIAKHIFLATNKAKKAISDTYVRLHTHVYDTWRRLHVRRLIRSRLRPCWLSSRGPGDKNLHGEVSQRFTATQPTRKLRLLRR